MSEKRLPPESARRTVMSGHTPGPWEVSKSHPSVIQGSHLIQFANGQGRAQVAMACGPYESDNATEVQLANARLIAAAPDLYQSLKELLGRYVEPKHLEDEHGRCDGSGIHCRAYAAIAKAEGR